MIDTSTGKATQLSEPEDEAGAEEALFDELEEPADDFAKLQLIANFLKRSIVLYSSDNPDNFREFEPEGLDANTEQQQQQAYEIVKDDATLEYKLRVSFSTTKKVLDEKKLNAVLAKVPAIEEQVPQWLREFVKCDLNAYLRGDVKAFVENRELIESKIKVLVDLSEAKQSYIEAQDSETHDLLFLKVVVLEQQDKLFFKSWFKNVRHEPKMHYFCREMIKKRTRIHTDWAFDEMINLQQYYPIRPIAMTLEDFNRVRTRFGTNERQANLDNLISRPDRLTDHIISTLFGFILRKENIEDYESELQQKISDINVSVRFLMSFLLQSADLGLRARLNHYLCMNLGVPMIMNCQKTFREQTNRMIFNSELIFSIEESEGIGAFAFGVGTEATFPCGKSQIANMITKPRANPTQPAFNVNDSNVFSNGQVDVFFDRCYQDRNGWVFMEGQGRLAKQVILSVMHLTNLVFIHFSIKDLRDSKSVDELVEIVSEILKVDRKIKICVLIRDASDTQVLEPAQFPVAIKDRLAGKLDAVIEVKNLKKEEAERTKLQSAGPIIKYFNEKVTQINGQGIAEKFTRGNYLAKFLAVDLNSDQEKRQRIMDALELS